MKKIETLEEIINNELDNLVVKKDLADSHISRLTERINVIKLSNGDQNEIKRLEDLVQLQITHKEELDKVNIEEISKSKFDTNNRINKRIN